MPADILQTLLNAQQAAAYLGCTERHVRNLVYTRRVPYVKVGRLVRFKAADLAEWIDANTVPPAPVPRSAGDSTGMV